MQRPIILERPELAVSFEELNALVGFAELQARERRYTPPAPEPQTRAREAGRTPEGNHPRDLAGATRRDHHGQAHRRSAAVPVAASPAWPRALATDHHADLR